MDNKLVSATRSTHMERSSRRRIFASLILAIVLGAYAPDIISILVPGAWKIAHNYRYALAILGIMALAYLGRHLGLRILRR